MKKVKVVIAGYGHVGRALTDLLLRERERLLKEKSFFFTVVAVADIQGAAFCAEGFPLDKLHTIAWDTGSVAYYPGYGQKGLTALETIELSGADMLVECTPSNFKDAEPAYTHVLQALALGLDVVLANKGPMALRDRELRQEAARYQRQLAYSCAAGAGLEILPLLASLGQSGELLRIRGIFNATCQYVLEQMGEGVAYTEAIRGAQQAGFAETDPSLDISGMDTAVKLLLQSNHAWGGGKTIREVKIRGIDSLTENDIIQAELQGKRYSLVGEALWQNDNYQMWVEPQALEQGDPLSRASYADKVALLTTRTQGEQLLYGLGGSAAGTAGSVLGDMVRIASK